jgi:hypothetical protein
VVSPNQYHVAGRDLTVSYFPDGRGPIGPAGAIHLVYQHAADTPLTFTADNVRTVAVPDLGTLASVTIKIIADVGMTTFTLILPEVHLAEALGASVHIETEGITTIHRSFLAPQFGPAQVESYGVTRLRGSASRGILEA